MRPDASENSQISPSTIVWAARAAGSHPTSRQSCGKAGKARILCNVLRPISERFGRAITAHSLLISSATTGIAMHCKTFGFLLRDSRRVATCLGFGLRGFFTRPAKSTKAAQIRACFFRSPATIRVDLPVPGQKNTFGVVKAAQARADFAVLAERGRRVLRVHLGAHVAAGLATLRGAFQRALA